MTDEEQSCILRWCHEELCLLLRGQKPLLLGAAHEQLSHATQRLSCHPRERCRSLRDGLSGLTQARWKDKQKSLKTITDPMDWTSMSMLSFLQIQSLATLRSFSSAELQLAAKFKTCFGFG